MTRTLISSTSQLDLAERTGRLVERGFVQVGETKFRITEYGERRYYASMENKKLKANKIYGEAWSKV